MPREFLGTVSYRPATDLGGVRLHTVLPGNEREVRRTPGLDADAPQRARREGRLIAWWQADDQSAARPIRGPSWLLRRWMRRNAVEWGVFVAAESIRVVGHVAVVWEPGKPGVARLATLETVAGTGLELARVLAGIAVHDAARRHPALAGLGFRQGSGGITLQTRDRQPI